jgi:hypothetical protein
MLIHVFKMHKEISQFLYNQGSNSVEGFKNRARIRCSAHGDVSTHFSELDTSVQGARMSMVTARNKISAFIQKSTVRIKCGETRNFINFSLLEEKVVSENEGMIITT